MFKNILLTTAALAIIFLIWGAMFGSFSLACGDKEGARNLFLFGVGMAKLTPIFVLIGAGLTWLML